MFAWPASMKQVFLRGTDTNHDSYVAQGKLSAPNFGVYLSRLSSSARASSSLRVIDSQSLQHSNHLVLNSYSAKKRCTHQMTVRVQGFGLLLPLLSLGCYSHCHLLQSESAAPGLTSSLKGLGSLLDCPGTLCDIVAYSGLLQLIRQKRTDRLTDFGHCSLNHSEYISVSCRPVTLHDAKRRGLRFPRGSKGRPWRVTEVGC